MFLSPILFGKTNTFFFIFLLNVNAYFETNRTILFFEISKITSPSTSAEGSGMWPKQPVEQFNTAASKSGEWRSLFL